MLLAISLLHLYPPILTLFSFIINRSVSLYLIYLLHTIMYEPIMFFKCYVKVHNIINTIGTTFHGTFRV